MKQRASAIAGRAVLTWTIGLSVGSAQAAGLPSPPSTVKPVPYISAFRLDGEAAEDWSGFSVAGGGDVNGDGYADVIVSAPYAGAGGKKGAGSTYVVFGKPSGFPDHINLSTLDGTIGFRLEGAEAGQESGYAVSSAGDFNGDGFGDIIVGTHRNGTTKRFGVSDVSAGSAAFASHTSQDSGADKGLAYIVFGKASGFPARVNLSDLSREDGFRVVGAAPGDGAAISVAGAGDVNGDQFDDVIIGAAWASPGGKHHAGSTHVLFGKPNDFPASFHLANVDGRNGFRLDGASEDDESGSAVNGTGDINGDGYDDILVGASRAGASRGDPRAGATYVVFGSPSAFAPAVDLSKVNGINGFRIDGAESGDGSGVSVASAGDFDGDGIGDVIIGAAWADPDGKGQAGSSYVLYGRNSGFPSSLSVSDLNGQDGFRIDGMTSEDWSGLSVAAAGDANADGLDDVIIGAPHADPGGRNGAGSSYLVFGRARSSVGHRNLSELNTYRADGLSPGDGSGGSVAGAGDVDGDGFADLIVGLRNANPSGRSSAGTTYVILGRRSFPNTPEALLSQIKVDPTTPSPSEGLSEQTYTLSAAIVGMGVVTSAPNAINCPHSCTAAVSTGEGFLLKATPEANWEFAGWSGACSGSDPCSIQIAHSQHVSALFRPSNHSILQVINPYALPSFDTSPDNLNLASFLNTPARTRVRVQAQGIVADDTSEGIVVYEVHGNDGVRLSAIGGVLTQYSDSFLARAPNSAVGDTLEIPSTSFLKVGGRSYAVALLRARRISVSLISVTASQRGIPDATLNLTTVRPPLFFVHGLWADARSFEPLLTYLHKNQRPTNDNVFPFEYPDSLPFDNNQIASNLLSEVDSAIEQLEDRGIIGGRIDVVAHGSGGLVVRALSSWPGYRSWHDRGRGRFRLITTIDTPGNGSELAHYLNDHASDRNLLPDRRRDAFWSLMCPSFDASTTVRNCFEQGGLAFSADASSTGGIAALSPISSSMKRLRGIDPNIAGSKWLAIRAEVGARSSLAFFMDRFITEGGGSATLRSIFRGRPNDGLATIDSQATGAQAGYIADLGGYAYFDLPWHSGGEGILNAYEVFSIVACWLESAGDRRCPSQVTPVRTTDTRSTPAVVPRLTFKPVLSSPPEAAELGVPIELAINPDATDLTHLFVEQRDEKGYRVRGEELSLTIGEGRITTQLTPTLLGNVTYRYWAELRGGARSTGSFRMSVSPPSEKPAVFRGDVHFRKIAFSGVGNTYQLHPAARYSDSIALNPATEMVYPSASSFYPLGGTAVSLAGHVKYRLLPTSRDPIVEVTESGTVTALRPGAATIEAAFGSSRDVIVVVVKPRSFHGGR